MWASLPLGRRRQALDEVRVGESRKLAQEGHQTLLKNSRWCRDHRQGTVDGSLPVPKFAQANNARTKPIRRGTSYRVILLMAMKRPGTAVFIGVSFGAMILINMAARTRFEAIRAVDVVQLIAVGMCFGVALFGIITILRKHQ